MEFKNMLTGVTRYSAPWQDELKPGDYFVNEQPIAGVVSVIEGEYQDPKIFDGMPIIYCKIDKKAHAPGFFWVTAYSIIETRGEKGIQCILDATRKITKEEFEQAVKEIQGGQINQEEG